MSEHLVQPQLDRYRERKLSAAELRTIDDHIGECEVCRAKLNDCLGDLEQLKASLLTDWTDMVAGVGAETEHLSYEDVAAFVSRELQHESLQKAQNHLNDCPECDVRVQNLLAFREEIESVPLPKQPDMAPGLWQRLASFRLPRLSPLQLVPAAAAAALVMAIGFWFASTSIHSDSALLALNDGGGRVTLDEQGNVRAPRRVPAAYLQMMKTALATQRIQLPPTLAGLLGRSGRLRGASGGDIPFGLVEPVGRVVETDQPTLRWRPLSGATSYIATISDRENEVATSPPLSATQWTVPQPLPRDVVYTWQVTALKEGERITSPRPPAPAARFKVLAQNKAQELELARKNFAGMHLLLGNLYTEAGLLDDAEREFEALLAANPQSPVAHKLVENVRSLLRAN